MHREFAWNFSPTSKNCIDKTFPGASPRHKTTLVCHVTRYINFVYEAGSTIAPEFRSSTKPRNRGSECKSGLIKYIIRNSRRPPRWWCFEKFLGGAARSRAHRGDDGNLFFSEFVRTERRELRVARDVAVPRAMLIHRPVSGAKNSLLGSRIEGIRSILFCEHFSVRDSDAFMENPERENRRAPARAWAIDGDNMHFEMQADYVFDDAWQWVD